MVNPEGISFFDAEPEFGTSHPQLDVFGSRLRRHVRHPSPEGLAEVCSQIYSFFTHTLVKSLRCECSLFIIYYYIYRY